jgi:sulfur-carrier protein adenylyltransferase/sulfurtransferase
MPFWFLEDLRRLRVEKSAIEQLGGSAEWLVGFAWGIDGEGLYLDATICAHGYNYEVRMRYPTHFPYVPPAVHPSNAEERWSTHQYVNGTLCLEWGPDTWHPSITGAQVLQSAYTLLEIENPRGSQQWEGTSMESGRAESRHFLTLGQEMRSAVNGRFYVGSALWSYLLGLPSATIGMMTFSLHRQSKSYLVFVQSLALADAPTWKNPELPAGVAEPGRRIALKNGLVYKTGLPAQTIARISTVDELLDALQMTREDVKATAGQDSFLGLLLADSSDRLHFLVLWDIGGNDLDNLASLPVEIAAPASRLPMNLKGLSERAVAIVGVGSAGSKIAVSLARMGAARFLLIDEDIFLPENICRHDLDWLNIGEHKVDALAQRLSMIAAGISVDTSRLNLTGQESPSALNALTTKLGTYDLIIDATANAEVFGLLAGVANLHRKPLLWLEVYAGGIGGMIARSRPGLDPDAHTMRRIYAQYTAEYPFIDAVVDSEGVRNYQLEDDRGNILAASDADVSVISAHGARFAVDTLLRRNPSHFPYSMYLIGLEQAWVFEAPFSVMPIATTHLLDGIVRQEVDVALLAETTSFLTYLIEQAEKAKETDAQA